MNLRQLNHAVCVAEKGAFGRAAEKLHITQSALSRSIQTLEQNIGLVLFDRGTTGVKVSAEGRLFLSHAKELLRQANGLKKEAELIGGAQVGAISFGSGPLALELVLPDVLPRLVEQHPALDIQVAVLPAVQLLDSLLEEKLEFFLADDQQFGDHPALETIQLRELAIGFFVRPTHPLAAKTKLNIEDLLAYNLASPSFMNQANDQEHRYISPILQYQWQGHLRCEYLSVLLATTQASDAILLTAAGTVAQQCSRSELVELSLQGRYGEMVSNLKMVKLAGRRLSPIAALLLELILKEPLGK